MPDVDEAFKAIKDADQREETGYARYLCELYLQEHPDHGPTLIRYANNLISLAQDSAAREALDHAQTVVPEKWFHLVLSNRGHLWQAEGDFAAAEEMFMQAHRLDPNDATYLIFAGSAAFAKGDIDRAEALARQAAGCPEGCIDEAYFNLGGYLLSKRQYREAADCYRRALEIDPTYEIAKKRLTDVVRILAHQGEAPGI